MSATYEKSIRLNSVYLDSENPRHDVLQAEPEIIAYLLLTEDIRPLAKDIASKGSISPIDLLALAPHPIVAGAYIPAEGNRRVCALKLLADPDRATTEADKRFFRALGKQMAEPITSFPAMVFSSKEAARPWVSMRHEGFQGGIGTKNWSPTQIARFNLMGSKQTNPNTQAVRLLDYARERNIITDSQLEAISLTLITRYLSNPFFRDALGLVNNKDLSITVPQDEFDTVVHRFLMDSRDLKSVVGSRTNAAERKKYADKLREEGHAPSTRGQPTTDVASDAARPTSSAGESVESPTEATPEPSAPTSAEDTTADRSATAPPKKNNPKRDDDKYVVPRAFKANIKKNTVLKRVYDELRTLPADDFPFCAAFLTRAVIEQAATLYIKQHGKTPPNWLHLKLLELEKMLDDDGVEEKARKPLRTMGSTRDDRGSADTLGAFVHGAIIPSKRDSIRIWDDVERALTHVFANLK
jgi:hypothetical protein